MIRPRHPLRTVAAALAAASALPLLCPASAEPMEAPDLLPAVERAIDAGYLREHERAELRVFHGQWENRGELASPPLLARAALDAGWLHDPVFADEDAPWVLRATAAVERGDLDSPILAAPQAGDGSAESIAISAMVFAASGGPIDDLVLDSIDTALADADLSTGQHAGFHAALARFTLLRHAGDADRARALAEQLGTLRQRNQLDWRVQLLEAELLIARSNRAEGAAALERTLQLNPRAARAWRLAGELAVDGLDLDRAEAIAGRLDAIAREISADDSAVHPWAELVRARVALRVDEPDTAIEHMHRSLERWPTWHEGIAWLAAAHAAGFQEDEAREQLARLEALAPGNAIGAYTVGAALSEQRQYERADGYLARAVERAPRWPEPWIELGLLRMQSGEDLGALDALRTAADLDPFHVRAANSLTLVLDLIAYDRVESEHFIVRYEPGIDEALARDMLVHLERIHERIAPAFGFVPDRKTIIELMPNHERFAVRIVGMPRIHTIAAATGPVIAMEAPKYGKEHTGEYDWQTVVMHEYVHTATLAVTENRIPHWFTEACAVNFETAERTWSTWQLLADALEVGRLFGPVAINIAFARPESPSDRPLAYAQSAWIYEYITAEYGQEHIRQMLALQREGLTEGEVIESVFGRGFEAFLEEFEVWASTDLVRHGVWGEPRLDTLLEEATLTSAEASAERTEALSTMGKRLDRLSRGLRARGAFEISPIEPTRALLESLAEAHPAHPEVLAALVEIELEERGQGMPLAESTRALLERYASARPVDPLPHRLLTLHYRATDERDAMLPHLEWLDSRETYSWSYAAELARLYAASGAHEQAYTKAERAAMIAPYRPEHRELAAAAALKVQRFDDALRHVRALTLLEPDRAIHRARLERLEALAGG